MDHAASPTRKGVVLAAGINSRSGDTHRLFAGLRYYFQTEGRFVAGDFVEATYAGQYAGGRWTGPAPYDLRAFEYPLATLIARCADWLAWLPRARPWVGEWHLVGYSLGGLLLLEAVTRLRHRAPDPWEGRLHSLTTLSSPLNGCNLGGFGWLADLFGPGRVGPEVVRLGEDPRHRWRIANDVAHLRARGVRVTTLVQADDAVIQPEDGVVGPITPDLIVETTAPPEDSLVARHLGHGRIVHEPRVWARLLAIIGPQPAGAPPPPDAHEPARVLVTPPPAAAASAPPPDDPLERELAELKARLRAEGRLPPT
ncbi:MAG: hypothetical protein IRZ14_14890 [Chloroflexi bacterium]|nr:hypothetical protein [Chloroflexota bacterium]